MLRLIACGILALPALLWQVLVLPVSVILSIPATFLMLYRDLTKADKVSPDRCHAIITGGSSGMGLGIARECVRLGYARLTLLARNVDNLDKAAKELKAMAKDMGKTMEIDFRSVDVSDASALKKMAGSLLKESHGNKIYLYCMAGQARPEYFEDTSVEVFDTCARVNQLGPIYTVQAFLPHMKAKGGAILLCSSLAGQTGVFGFTAYSPTKFALQGFAQALHMELAAASPPIHVMLAFPPDTDTPGYQAENETKPAECALISEDGGLWQPDKVAKAFVRQATKPNPPFQIALQFDHWMLCCLTTGFSPVTSWIDAVGHVTGLNLFRWVALFYLQFWWITIRKYQGDQKKKEKEEVANAGATKSSEETHSSSKDE